MFSQILIRGKNVTNIKIGLAQLPSFCSRKISSIKPALTLVLRNSRELRLFGASRLHSCASRHNESIKAKQKSYDTVSVRSSHFRPLQIDTKITNNVFLFKYDKPKFYTFLNIFAPIQCLFWIAVSYSFYAELPRHDKDKQSLYEYCKEHFPIVLVTVLGTLLGISSLMLIWWYTSRSLRFVILKKGGNDVTLVTYHPFKSKIGVTVPLERVSCSTSRKEMCNYLPIKLKGRSLFYMLDARGDFPNPRLFDFTVGVPRFSN